MLLVINSSAAYKLVVDTLYQYPILFAVLTFLIGWLFMPLVIRIAKERNMVVRPNKRTAHQGDIPNIGGLDIFLSFLIFFILFAYNHVPNAHYVVTGLVMIWFVGFLDDLVVFKPRTKLLGELLAGVTLIVFAVVRIGSLYGLFGLECLPLGVRYGLSVLLLAGIVASLILVW